MRLTIEHHTQYVYTTPVNYTIQQLRLTPQSGFGQHVKYWDIKVQGQMHEYEDAFGNTVHTLVVDKPHTELSVTVMGEVETGVKFSSVPVSSRPSRLSPDAGRPRDR